MGQKGEETRTKLLDATQTLIEGGGYFGTGLNQVIATSGAPRGSLYFHFPGGKDQLVSESLRRAGTEITMSLGKVAEDSASPAEAIENILMVLGDRLEASGWTKGCPVATVALEVTATSDDLQKVCSQVYRDWERVLRQHLGDDDLATTVLALIEGALLLARAHRSREPLQRVARQISTLL